MDLEEAFRSAVEPSWDGLQKRLKILAIVAIRVQIFLESIIDVFILQLVDRHYFHRKGPHGSRRHCQASGHLLKVELLDGIEHMLEKGLQFHGELFKPA